MKKSWLALVALFVLLAGIQAQDMKQESTGSGDAMMSVDPSKAVFDLTGLAPGVIPFSSEAAAQAIARSKRVVYFFAASWCPTCRETYRNLKAGAGTVPSDLVIIVVDYDKSSALKAKYGVTYQHTFVSLGSKGEKLKVWSGTSKVADIVRNAVGM
jgi:thiol-disulfide isomerase/thioredoxin